jgi:hypothetical protein
VNSFDLVCAAVALPDGGECDGFHLSLRADLNDEIRIEADRQETTWASIYVRLRGGGLPGPDSVAIPPGSTIVANCELQSATGLRLKPP